MKNPISTLKAPIIDSWIRVKSSYWFIPSLMTAAAIGLAFGLVRVDERIGAGAIERLGLFAANQPEGARALLATVAGSMITVAGVTFSMTLLMLSYASSQIGPRVMASLSRDRGSQIVLGTFIAAFIYCLVVLRTIRAADESADSAAFVPHVAVLAGLVLALLGVAVLIYFIHHIPRLLDVPTVVSMLGRQLLGQARDAFPEAAAERRARPRSAHEDAPAQTVRLTGDGGYLRVVEYGELQATAERVDRMLETLVVPGEFCVHGTPLVDLRGGTVDDDCVAAIRSAFSWGGQRTPEQDILFLVEQLAEIAGKALSKGINDQFTALLCIDQVERVLADLAQRDEPERVRPDHGRPRLIVRSVARKEVADRFLLPLRQFSLGDLAATERLLEMLARSVARLDSFDPLRAVLMEHYVAIRDDAGPALEAASHRERIDALCARHGLLAAPPAARPRGSARAPRRGSS